jgi:uncharacterized protein YchJ
VKRTWREPRSFCGEALSVKNVRDRQDLLERLEELLQERRLGEEVDEIGPTQVVETESIELRGNVVKLKTKFDFGEEGLPLDELPKFMAKQRLWHEPMIEAVRKKTTGRNTPCPCGSGKKYKKCCGR